jgi:hypothetical protein
MTMPPGGYPGQPQDPQQPGSGGFGPPGGTGPGGPGPGGTGPGGTGPGGTGPGGTGPGGFAPPGGFPPAGGPEGSPGGGYGGQPGPGAPYGGGQYGPPGGYGTGPGQQGGPPPYGTAPGGPAVSRPRNRAPLIIVALATLAAVLSAVVWGIGRGGNDPKAQAEKFMTAVQKGEFDAAKNLLCKDGRDNFSSMDEMRTQLVDTGKITGFTLGSVSDSTFDGDKRKDVGVSVQMGDGTTKPLTLSMTKEGGKYQVCGFGA